MLENALSLHFPGRHALAGFGILAVLQLDSLRKQFIADAVGLGPVLVADEGEAFVDLPINLIRDLT